MIVASTFLLYLIFILTGFSLSRIEVDVSWNFDQGEKLEGWANATSEEIDMLTKVQNGELLCTITGFHPKLDSPNMYLELNHRDYLIMRASYLGRASSANLLLKSGNTPLPNEELIFDQSYWTNRKRPNVIYTSSPPISSAVVSNNLVDGDPYSYFEANANIGLVIDFDLQNYRWITSLKILPFGNSSSPKRCLLQKSMTSGVGPFQTALSFTVLESFSNPNLSSSLTEQEFTGVQGYSRYWRLVVIDNYGAESTAIREISLEGYDDRVTIAPFNLINNGSYYTYYIPIFSYLNGILLRMRFEFNYNNTGLVSAQIRAKLFEEQLSIDHITIARAPEIWRVRGCLDKYFESANYQNPKYNVTSYFRKNNGNLVFRSYRKNLMSLPFATTYDCPLNGGKNITIDGYNFGANPIVTIGENPCPVMTNSFSPIDGRLQTLICKLPKGKSGKTTVNVKNGINPGMFHVVPSLEYRVAPPVPKQPIVTNIAARKVDLVWTPPGDEFEQMTVTGYKILWFKPQESFKINNLTVGNVTTTSVRGLDPATEYVFAIAAMAEGFESTSLPTDLYGRRDATPDALLGTFSLYTNITGTLLFDFDFSFFDSNKTLNSSGSTPAKSLGPTGQYGSEGHYGLVLVGSANIQNCNVSSTCCDGYNASIGVSSCGNYVSVCAVLPARQLAYDYVVDGITRRGVPTNLPYSNGAPASISFLTLDELILNKGASLPSSKCGPALRLTPSLARSSGASWYRRKMNVEEGFDTFITFEISNPSMKCKYLDDVNTYCRSRGADGFAFVIQNYAPDALGLSGSGLGYEGIFNALSVEMDTFYNFDQMDYYENHISVMTQGFRYNISANHSRALANSNNAPDLTSGIHTIRIKYEPNFDNNAISHPSFQVNGYTTWFLNNADFKYGGEGDWGTGIGLLYVYIDDMYSPIITTPINLGSTLNLDNGRAYVGLTAATGAEYWQCHDILQWQYSSLFIDQDYTPPLLINNEGAYTCVNQTECVHRPDYEHYIRKNKIAP